MKTAAETLVIRHILGPVMRAVVTWLGRRRLPKIEGTLTLPDLSTPAEVIGDRWGVPHIYAANTHDSFLAQGFVHAQDQLWQMELNRRIATGRLSELFGDVALDTDRITRTFGFHRLGQGRNGKQVKDHHRGKASCRHPE